MCWGVQRSPPKWGERAGEGLPCQVYLYLTVTKMFALNRTVGQPVTVRWGLRRDCFRTAKLSPKGAPNLAEDL